MRSNLSLLFSIFLLVGCGDDAGVADSGTVDLGPVPDGSVGDAGTADADLPNCTGLADGVSCGEGVLCLMNVCVSTRCGDGFVDTDADELCDDGNDVDGDGCDSCAFSCEGAAACDDMDPCTGAEICNADHICEPGTPPTAAEAVACELEGAAVGVCIAGLCAAPGCGNGALDAGEACDDGNEEPNDGCEADCSFSCTEDVDCLDGDVCNGEETCDVDAHMCGAAAEALDCDDSEPCTEDSCRAEDGCRNIFMDDDSDGYSPMTCVDDGLLGDDCDDTDGTINPGADELCDAIDHDCSGAPDNDIVEVVCLLDSDGDGYGNESRMMSACACPSGYIPPRADEEVDCADRRSSVNPGQTEYFTSAYCNGVLCRPSSFSFDYNCDGSETARYARMASTCRWLGAGMFSFCGGSGWVEEVPECGESANFQQCSVFRGLCVTTSTRRRTQPCR